MISVVIPAYNAADTLGDCLRALSKQSLPNSLYEIIVVDDGSTDDTAQIASEFDATVVSQARSWPASARNHGTEVASGDIICFTDADCEPSTEWLEQMVYPFSDQEIVACTGAYTTGQRSLVARFVQLEYEDKYDLLSRQQYIDFIDTYSAAYRREIFRANGGFDRRFHYLEDQELSFRLAARGYKMVFQPQATVAHLHSESLLGYMRKKYRIGYWKAQVVRRFPERGVRDSHTPQVMKVQMALMALIFGTLLSSLLTRWALLALATLLLVFLASTVPFTIKAWGKDRSVATISPLMLAARGTALGLGYGWGVLRPSGVSTRGVPTISGFNYLLKRLMDITGSLFGLTITAILSPIIALAIKVTSPGPVLFQQLRVGQGGKTFTMYKFRSMDIRAQEQLEELVDVNRLSEPAFKLRDDPRVTPTGRFLRRWSLDELPQFWNVITGDMSLVGPRPEEARIVALYNDYQRRRLSVKPGITGPMQIDERGDLSLNKRLELEIKYIENYSIWRDLKIIALTIPAVIRGIGAR